MRASTGDNNKKPLRKREKPESSSTRSESGDMNIEDISNARYTCDLTKLEELRTKCPWNDHPKYLTKAAISPSAVTKMVGCYVCVY